jgi:hypothetical protein
MARKTEESQAVVKRVKGTRVEDPSLRNAEFAIYVGLMENTRSDSEHSGTPHPKDCENHRTLGLTA